MFTSSDIKSLQEAYQAVYDDELRSEIVEDDDLFEDLEIIDELSDEELDEIVEEIVYEMLDEGYDIDDVEYIFEDVLVERRLSSKEQKLRKARNKAANQASQQASRESAGRARRKRIGDAVTGALSKAGEMARSARDYVMKKGGEAKQEIDRRSSNASNRAKAAATRAAMKATGVSSMDVPTKDGGKRKREDSFAPMRKTDRESARQAIRKSIGDRWRSAKAVAGITGSIAKDEAKRARRSAEHQAGKAAQAVASAPGRAVSAAKSGLKGLIRRGAERVQRGAERVAKRMSEEVETFDIVLDFLLSEGIVETLEDAQWVMVNELDYEDIDAILEAYGEPMTKRQEYLTKKVERMNKEKSGSAHTSTGGMQSAGAALNQANKSANQMRGRLRGR